MVQGRTYLLSREKEFGSVGRWSDSESTFYTHYHSSWCAVAGVTSGCIFRTNLVRACANVLHASVCVSVSRWLSFDAESLVHSVYLRPTLCCASHTSSTLPLQYMSTLCCASHALTRDRNKQGFTVYHAPHTTGPIDCHPSAEHRETLATPGLMDHKFEGDGPLHAEEWDVAACHSAKWAAR